MSRITILLLFLISTSTYSQIKVSGNVFDAEGRPIELVAVVVKGSLSGTMTDAKGFYSLPVAAGDSVTLLFACLGYHKAERIIPRIDRDMRLNVRLTYSTLELSEVSVVASRRQTTTMQTLDAGRLRILPDPSGGSIESLVVTQAGVSSNNELSSQYSVRGGSFDENIVYVNGMEVYRPLLIRSGEQEGLSFINPGMTESVSFSAGGFEARYGDRMSSVLDITYKRPASLEGSASASLLGGSVYVGGSHGILTHVSGIRYKTGRSLLRTLDTEAEYDPVFLDFQTYLTLRLPRAWELGILGNLSSNSYRFIPISRETLFGTANNPRRFGVGFSGLERDLFRTVYGAATLKRRVSSGLEYGIQFSGFSSSEEESYDITGRYRMDLAYVSESESAADAEVLSIASYHEHARNRLSSSVLYSGIYGDMMLGSHRLRGGITVQSERINDRISEWESRDSAGYWLPHGGGSVNVITGLYADSHLESVRVGSYLQDGYRFRTGAGLYSVIGGLRLSYWSYNRELLLSPRISGSYVPNALPDLIIRAATGYYYQPPFYKELRREVQDVNGNSTIELNTNLLSQRSIHFIIGGDYGFRLMGRPFKLTTELYYKLLSNLNPYTVDNVKIRYYGENCASGYIGGVDLKLFGEFVPGVDSWLSLSLMRSSQLINGVLRAPLANSQGYNFSLYFQDYVPGYKRAMLSLRGVLAGGYPVTAPGSGYERIYGRTPAYRRVDIGFTYQLLGGSDAIMDGVILRDLKSIWLGVDVFNLLDIRNTVSYYWLTDVYNERHAVPNYLTGRQLNFRISVDF